MGKKSAIGVLVDHQNSLDDQSVFAEEFARQAVFAQKISTIGWPDSLVKAVMDSFDYECCLSNGTRIRFAEAVLTGNPEWVRLREISEFKTGGGEILKVEDHSNTREGMTFRRRFARGIDVRVKDIIWCCDAPHDS